MELESKNQSDRLTNANAQIYNLTHNLNVLEDELGKMK